MGRRGLDAKREAAFRQLYDEHFSAIAAYVARRVSTDQTDVIAEVFTVAWRRLDQLPESPEDRLWLFAVARHAVARQARSQRRRWLLGARLAAQPAGPAATESAALPDLVRLAVERLGPAERELVRLVYWEGLTHREAATVLGCSENAVALRLRRARERLRQDLPPPGPATHTPIAGAPERSHPRPALAERGPRP